ncbi:thiamine biosynthesis protein ThiJ [Streptomyces sp. 150FB]|uniref:type 1 glutamine amidotransferase domain-containing protein n=1 Tax=Streptomyces sp. 150FB TaxID=1576605 RepID=UPI000588FD24|nr:type 1 glutamine amidotransferase domain-containing protein [Streptomyces sp. 150FB]KIF76920.1 thiamine biosynthesis protein ThiJ [Streptomyces sp. 150FB]
MSTAILMVITGANAWTLNDGSKYPTGYWASEFIHPHQVFTDAGLDITIATPGGVEPTVDAVSLSPAMNGDDQASIDTQRAYLATFGDTLASPAVLEKVDPADFDAVYVCGGHGPMEDLGDNAAIGKVVTTLLDDPDKIVSALCHGVAALLPARAEDGSWPFSGRKLTSLTNEEETAVGLADKAPWLLETRLREAGADFQAGPAFLPHVIVDGNLVTGQNPASAHLSAEAVVKILAGK